MYRFLILLCLCLSLGCNKASDALKAVGITAPTAEEIAAQKEREQQEKELAAQKLKDADALVAKWADKVQENPQRVEGLTDIDPWGQPIKVNYHQEWFTQIASISSAGPDATFSTSDDLVRTRKSTNVLGIANGDSPLALFLLIWGVCIVLAILFSTGLASRRAAKGKPRTHRHPIGFVCTTLALAPIVAFVYGLQFFGGVAGASGDFFDGFDFDFDIDFDIDIDL
jgi:hypothetical protein